MNFMKFSNFISYSISRVIHSGAMSSGRFHDPVYNKKDKIMKINNWIISEFILNKLLPAVSFHPFPLNELHLMTAAVCFSKPSYIFDWGTHIGKSARIFYEITKSFNIKSEIHSIDLPDDAEHPEHPRGKRGIYVKGIKEVMLHQGDGLDIALKIYKSAKKNSKALFFLDGDHEFGSVKRELLGIIRNCRNPAILLHDTYYQSPNSKFNSGPYLALKSVLSRKRDKFHILSTETGFPGMTFIY